MQKRAEMGVGTLIVFIAMLLVAAVAAGVLIQTAGSLQEQSLSTGQQARSQISTNARVIEVSATDGRDGNLTDFRQIVKLSPGSDPIKLDQTIFTFNTKDHTSTLKYRGTDGLCTKNNSNGYNTWNEEEIGELEIYMNDTLPAGVGAVFVGPQAGQSLSIGIDLDDDGIIDSIRICEPGNPSYDCPGPEGAIEVNLTADGLLYVEPYNSDGSWVNLSNGVAEPFNFSRLPIPGYGYFEGFRTAGSGAYFITDADPGIIFRTYESEHLLDEDLDNDGLDDRFAVNATHAIFFFGNGSTASVSLGENLNDVCVNISLSNAILRLGSDIVAYLSMEVTCAGNKLISEDARVRITPYEEGRGYFTAIYETEGTNHVPGNLQRGDVLRICYEAPGNIEEDSLVRLNFIPKIGTPTLTEFVTPDVISVERVYLYP